MGVDSGETLSGALDQTTLGFCIYIDTLLSGPVPIERNSAGNPFIYPMRTDAEREIAEDTIERIQQFLMGESDFETL